MSPETGILPLERFDFRGKKILLRLDINSPIDPASKKIVNENRIDQSLPTIRYLLDNGAAIALIAHQGDTLDYQNLIAMSEHADKLTEKLGVAVRYIDDVAGPAAQEAVKALRPGQMVLLGNLRYLTEEVSTFEDAVKLEPPDMLDIYHVRNLAPLFDLYVNDAFSAAHRNSPSMVAFQELLPAAGGILLIKEYAAMTKVLENPARPAIFILGGAKIADAFGMIKQVLINDSADKILSCGVVGIVMLVACGVRLGSMTERYIAGRSLDVFVDRSKEYLTSYPDRFVLPVDFARELNGSRDEIQVSDLPVDQMLSDIGSKTISLYTEQIGAAGTIFMNGPPGIYENPLFELGTRSILSAISEAKGFSLIGGGDTVSAAQSFVDTRGIDYVSTAGGAMIRFLSGKKLPLIAAMEKASARQREL